MPLYYPVGNVSNPIEWLQWINTLTSNYFGPAVVVAFFFVMFFALKNYETEKAFATSSFLTAMFSFLFMLLDLVDIQIVMLATVMTIFSVFLVRKTSGEL